MTATSRPGAAIGALLAIAGAVVGLVLAPRLVVPSPADVRAEADALVPAGVMVEERSAGYQGSFPSRGPYHAFVYTIGGGSVADRETLFTDQVRGAGWDVESVTDRPNARVLQLDGDRYLDADISLRSSSEVSIVTVEVDSRPGAVVAAGAIAGAGAGLGGWWLWRRVRTSATPGFRSKTRGHT